MFAQSSFRPLSPLRGDSHHEAAAAPAAPPSDEPARDSSAQPPNGNAAEFVPPRELKRWLDDIARRQDSPVQAPVPRRFSSQSLGRSSAAASRRVSMERRNDSPEAARLGSPVRATDHAARPSLSPSRPHPLNALSPLQTFSPLQPSLAQDKLSETSSVRGHSRTSSLTRSLSRKESVYAQAAMWRLGDDENVPTGRISRLTLVKAPARETPLRRRAKSSSSLASFEAPPGRDEPATTARGPRRSFAAASFAAFSPMTPRNDEPMHHRAPGLGLSPAKGDTQEIGIHRKMLSPEEVVDLARSLQSPVAADSPPSLRRRKSSGAASRRESTASAALDPVEYVQLEAGMLLPYVDRPREVAQLMANPVNDNLFALLRAAFPKHAPRPDWQSRSPLEWSWDELALHLTQTDRAKCPDYEWVMYTREAVRRRSVALWEKLGTCLGCDSDLLTAGAEESSETWGGLDDGVPSDGVVFVEGLAPASPESAARAERDLKEAFGSPVADLDMPPLVPGGMATIGEGDEEPAGLGLTTAQRAGKRATIDPMTSPSAQFRTLSRSPPRSSVFASSASSVEPASVDFKGRSKSFVGLQVVFSPKQSQAEFARSPVAYTDAYVHERGPGSPIFVSSFNSLSLGPNLGRQASKDVVGGGAPAPDHFRERKWQTLNRKPSGTGLSESAITFASESEHDHE